MTEIKPKHVIMFAGKGGVGKTTCAGAAALHYALMGEPTLIISTDPTPSLSHIFEIKSKQKPVKVLDNLFLAELGLDEVKQMWDRKFGREVYEVFSSFVSVQYAEFVDFMSSILPGLSDEFMVDYIRELSLGSDYDHIVWDTAPLGQTLGLLETPSMLREHLRPAPRIYSRLKLGAETRRPVLEILKGWEKLSGQDMEFLRDGVRFVLVTIAEALAVEQLDTILGEMNKYGFKAEQLTINNVIKEIGSSAFLKSRADQQKQYLELLYGKYSRLQIVEIPLFPHEIKGIERLRLVEKQLFPRR
ncbi:MAG TPA: ArsA family ATPase [Dehalococcoidales bacterium]